MDIKTCCITGHREFDTEKIDIVREALKCAIVEAIGQGYTNFISGFADGTDLYFASIVAEFKKKHHLSLEAAIPYHNRIYSKNEEFQRLLRLCDSINIHSKMFTKSCLLARNRFMVQSSNLVIAVYDGRKTGGTLYTMRYAYTMKKEVKIIQI